MIPFEITGHDPRRIGDDLPAAELRIPAAEKQGDPAQLVHPDFKGDPRPRGGFVEDHPQGLSLEGGMLLPLPEQPFQAVRLSRK